MSDTTTPTDQAPEVDQDQTPPAGGDNDQDQGKPQGRQARRDQAARERAAELQAERDALAGRLAAAQTREIEAIAGEILAQPGDLLELGKVDLADLLDADGNVDPDAVAAMAAALVDQRPGLSVHAEIKRGYHDWGHTRRNEVGFDGEGTSSWSDAFGAAGRGNGMRYT